MWIGSDPTRSGRFLELPCGRCIGCKLDRARAWSIRIQHEARLYDSNWMATFTYDDEHLPKSRSLEYRDFQLMMKRLRRSVRGAEPGPKGNYPLRFFCAGEYGSRRKRPHFHAILFNAWFKDAKRFVNDSFWSKALEDTWSLGHVQLDLVTPGTASYVSGYALKKVYGTTLAYEDVVCLSTGEVSSRRKEFVTMSRRPGLGAWFIERYHKDVFPVDYVVVDGERTKVPRYYWDWLRRNAEPGLVEDLAYARFLRAEEQRGESAPERRAVREEYQERRLASYGARGDL